MSDEGPNNQELIDENPPPALFDLEGVDMMIIAVRERRNAGDPGANDLHSRTKKANRHPHINLITGEQITLGVCQCVGQCAFFHLVRGIFCF